MPSLTIISRYSLLFLLTLLLPSHIHAQDLKQWPREVQLSIGSITIYQPQIESLDGNSLKGRAALAYHNPGSDSPVFGVAWFTAQVQINRESRTVRYVTLEITDTRFPNTNKELEDEFKEAVREGVRRKNLTFSLDELTTALAAIEQQQKQDADLNNTPPEIIYMEKPALLVFIDGKTMLQDIENSDYQAVMNTPYPLFFDKGKNGWFLNAANKVWYSAEKADGPWHYSDQPPAALVQIMAAKSKENVEQSDTSEEEITAENAPVIVVVHQPSELIVSTGKAEFTPLTDDLLVMSNTDSDVFMDVKSQDYFLIISGRWYKSSSMTGSWQYVASDKLPATFLDLPKDSRYIDIRASVAGTDEAREAVMDAQIPQTAAVTKGVVKIDVVYDGKPQFKKIDGTGLQFAVNCSETVIKADSIFFLVKDGVWYIASSATGPWDVSDQAPPGIENVPPSSPVYNTKYVYIYDSTPEVVYVGYTPGYVGSYVYGPTIVYGTGYYYHPWISPYYYYPRPVTYGFSVTYNSWTGWGYGMSWSSGPFRFGFYTGGGYHGRYWGGRRCYGPRGYRPSYRQVRINNIHINRTRNFNTFSNHNNLYLRKSQRAAIQNSINARPLSQANKQKIQNRASTRQAGQLAAAGGTAAGAAALANRSAATGKKINSTELRNKAARLNTQKHPNNVLADKSGNVLRNTNGQWQQRNNGQWQNKAASTVKPAANRTVRQSSGYNRASSIDRQQYSRQRATARTKRYSSPSRSSSRSSARRSGGSRGRSGGGRRR